MNKETSTTEVNDGSAQIVQNPCFSKSFSCTQYKVAPNLGSDPMKGCRLSMTQKEFDDHFGFILKCNIWSKELYNSARSFAGLRYY